MVAVESVARSAGIEPNTTHGLLLIKQDDAEAFVKKASEMRVSIAGIDRFIQSGDFIQPDMDHIADFSAISSDYSASNQEAMLFVKSLPRNAGAFLEFTLLSDNEGLQ